MNFENLHWKNRDEEAIKERLILSTLKYRGNKSMGAGKTVGTIILILAAILGLSWAVQGNDFFMYKVFAPKYEQVRRETFEQTKSYRQGMIQELQNMQFQYVQAAPEQKQALASIILHRASDFDLGKGDVSPDLQAFLQQLKRDRTTMR